VPRAPRRARRTRHELESRALRARVGLALWRSQGVPHGAEAPLLVVHDGPEYARRAGLVRDLERFVAEGRIPPLRAALLAPVGDRMETYSASATYARALAREVLPRLRELAPTRDGRVIGVGCSLGAVGILHAYERFPGSFGGLYLQSGSFFQQRFDAHESGFRRWARLTGFVEAVLAGADPHPTRLTMTCGRDEENLRNNRAVARALRRHGYAVRFHEHGGGHDWAAWRTTFDPHLIDLVNRVSHG
jgi:enterochelin esterase family protein